MVQMMRRNARKYIHAKWGDMPAERQVTWRGCARDWITNGQLGNTLDKFPSGVGNVKGKGKK